MNLLLDTNVLIDYLGRKAPFFHDAQMLVAAGYFKDATLWTPAGSVKDAFCVLSRYVASERIQDALVQAFELITPVTLSKDDLVQAARLKWPDFENCLVAMAALKCKADYIITRDVRGFERSMVPAISPAEWLELMRETRDLEYAAAKL